MPCLEAKLNYLRAFLFTLFAVAVLPVFANTAAPALVGDAARGQTLSQTCVACHGADGKAIMPAYPNLGGQHASYIVHSLVEFKKGPSGMRNNPIMLGMATPLSDQDMADLAAYYESQPAVTGEANASLVELGEKIYRGGNIDDKVPACSGCHGPKGEGIGSAKYPRIAGQNSDYTVAQLMAFQKGERKGPNGMMGGVVKHMTPAEMTAVASYIQGLH
jgi:cytochrome c553